MTLYRWALGLAPVEHRRTYADEQLRLFEEVWRRERPAGWIARSLFFANLFVKAAIAALAVRFDRRRQALPAGGGGWTMGSDLRFTWRAVVRSPWYSATVVGVMAVTIGLAATTLAVVDGVLFRRLSFPDADRLVRIQPDFEGIGRPAPSLTGLRVTYGASAVDLQHWQQAAPDVPMTGFRAQPWGGLGTGVNDWAAGMALVQANFFDVIGMRPLFGGFAADDFRRDQAMRPVLATYGVWQSRYGGRPDVIGAEIVLNHEPRRGVRVVGVMPPAFVFPSVSTDVSFLAPLVLESGAEDPTNRSISEVLARLPETVAPETLRARLMPALGAVAALRPPQGPKPDGWSDAGWRRQGPYDAIQIVPLAESLREHAGPLFRASMLAVVLLVLIAAANVSSLMTARALEREREFAVRRALGGGVMALWRLWALEAGVLLVMAAAIGVAMAPVMAGFIVPLLPESIVLLKSPAIDWRIGLMVAAGLAALVVIVSVLPVRRSWAAPASGERGASERVRSRGRVLVIAGQVAVAFALTVLGASLVGSVMAVYAHEQPVNTESIAAISAMVQAGGGDTSARSRSVRVEHVRRRLLQIPGVQAATASGAQVLAGGGALPEFVAPAGTRHPRNTDAWPVTDGFYETLAPHLVAGRVPTSAELQSDAPVIVVSERAAEAYWPDGNALGRTLEHYWSKEFFTVVGVVRDVRWVSWDEESPAIYAPYSRVSRYSWVTFFLRTERPHAQVLRDAISAIEEADRFVKVRRAAPLTEYFRETIAIRRFQSWLFGGFAAAALVVVGSGLLGLLAMSAARRTREVGIRCALGATPGSVVGQLVREQMAAVVAGVIIGGVAAAWALGFIKSWLYELTPADPRIWSAALACLLTMAAIGILIPAVRASRVDPLVALREE
jgi:predicted permease